MTGCLLFFSHWHINTHLLATINIYRKRRPLPGVYPACSATQENKAHTSVRANIGVGTRGADVRVRIAHVLHELEEVSFHELEHKKKLVVLSDDFLQLDDVGVAQLFQRLHLSELHALLPTAAQGKSEFGGKVTKWKERVFLLTGT